MVHSPGATTAVMALSWRWIFNDTYGIAGDVPIRLGLLSEPIAWLARPATAFASLVIADVWKTTPFVTILLLAGLQTIPSELHEALAIDGAGSFRRFRLVTLTLLRPALAPAVVLRVIPTLGIFDLVWILTGGGTANATKTASVALLIVFSLSPHLWSVLTSLTPTHEVFSSPPSYLPRKVSIENYTSVFERSALAVTS